MAGYLSPIIWLLLVMPTAAWAQADCEDPASKPVSVGVQLGAPISFPKLGATPG